jgi:hypothetical protein
MRNQSNEELGQCAGGKGFGGTEKQEGKRKDEIVGKI